jgi:hypothetical protein
MLQKLCQRLYLDENLFLAFRIIRALNRETFPRELTCLGASAVASAWHVYVCASSSQLKCEKSTSTFQIIKGGN